LCGPISAGFVFGGFHDGIDPKALGRPLKTALPSDNAFLAATVGLAFQWHDR